MLKPYKPPEIKALNLRVGALLDRQRALILAGLDKLETESVAHTIVLLWETGKPWLGKTLNWTSASACSTLRPDRRFVLVGEGGEFVSLTETDYLEGRSVTDATLSAVMNVEGFAYAVGTKGTVLRYDGGQSWKGLSFPELAGSHFESVAAYSSGEMYVVGWHGAMCLLSEGSAKRLDGLTNVILTSVCCAPDGFVYVCGQKGIILRGRQNQWVSVDHGDTTEDLWDIHSFLGRIFVTSTRFLYELKGDRLARVRFGADLPMSFYKLSSVPDSVMLSVGKKDAFTFDGAEWTRVL